jgi:hypothetical protein
MFLELIAVVFAGIATAGVVMLVNKLTGGYLPRWVMPIAAGAGMIAATISSEYGWYDRNTKDLPEGFEVIQTVENQSFYRPWTYLKPDTERFVAVDHPSLKTNPDLPDQRMVDLYFFGRWAPVNKIPVLVDCAGLRRATLADGMEFDADGQVSNADWVSVERDDPILNSVCEVL